MAILRRVTPIAAALAFAAIGPLQAQTANRSVVQVPQRPPPASITPATPGPGAPSPSGLPSPSPFPAGMPPLTGPGLPASNVPVTPAADGTVLMPSGTAATATGGYGGIAAPTGVLGAAGGGPYGPSLAPGPGPYTALQVAQSFLLADANRDGTLTRAEALRLTIMTMSFEDMDRNKDGVISRSEYEDSVR